MLTVGDKFPEYNVKCNVGSDPESLKGLSNADYDGKWVCYFFYPKDFTFICPTEIAEFNTQLSEFNYRDFEVVAPTMNTVTWHGVNLTTI